jgi:predicted AlkP superfamily phosphohydrolase/phosphomutase
MKICILGLDAASPELLFGDERLTTVRRLMEMGVYGQVESVLPPDSIPGWMCLTTSQDPGSLGVYGACNRAHSSYERPTISSSNSIPAFSIWDKLEKQGKKSILIGVPPNFPPRKVNGISIGCFLTPNPASEEFTHPASIKGKITQLTGEYPVDVKDYLTAPGDRVRDEIFAMSSKHWQVVRWMLSEQEWDYFHYVDIGLDRAQRRFWSCFDRQHRNYRAGNPYESVIPDYYLWLDEQIGSLLELLDSDTVLLVASTHGAQRSDGAALVNQWLIDEGLLVLDEPLPSRITPFHDLSVNWAKTRVWCEGGSCARIFFNLQGREPQGAIPAADYETLQQEMSARLQAWCNNRGQPLVCAKPQEIYSAMRNVVPDLIVYFGPEHCIDSVGCPAPKLPQSAMALDGCNNSRHGAFVLSAPNCPLTGEYKGAHLLDIAPTLLDLAGYEVPSTMHGHSLVAGMNKKAPVDHLDEDPEQIIRDRLAGLGYV